MVSTRTVELSGDELEQRSLGASFLPGEYVEISVRDTGCGMDAETQANIFDPFFSTKADGRGLGLAAVMGIVRAHGWSLQVDSALGEGTTFVLLATTAQGTTSAAQAEVVQKPTAKIRVLVVDDEPAVLAAVSRILVHAGMEVRRAADGGEAVEVYREHHESIDCVILDLNMPVLDGEEAFQELKVIQRDVRVLLTSGYAEQSVLDRFEGAGLWGVLQKPIRASTLLNKINSTVTAPLEA